VSRTEYDELKARVDRLETLLHSRAPSQSNFAPQPGTDSSSSQTQQQPSPTRLSITAAAPPGPQGNTVPAPMLPYIPISPPGSGQAQGAIGFPAGLMGSSRPSVGPSTKDYGASEIALRSPNSPAGSGRTTALPPLASLANGPFDGPAPPPPNPSRLPPREHRERAHRELQHQPYAPLPQLPLQQPLQQLHHQTKNCRAQTLTPLGERLRLSSLPQGPAAVPRLPRHYRSSSNCTRRLRLLMFGVRGRCHWPTLSAFHCPLLRFLGRQRNGVRFVRSENGSSGFGWGAPVW
jgi:hypothetical protein